MRPLLLRSFSLVVLSAAMLACGAMGATDGPVLFVPANTRPLHVTLDLPEGFVTDTEPVWELKEQGGAKTVVPVDMVPAIEEDGARGGKRRRVLATIPPAKDTTGSRRFVLSHWLGAYQMPPVAFDWRTISPTSVELREGRRPVFVYNHGDITNEKVPKSDFRRTRGCYVHPVYGLDGEVLTDDFPRDHYHHHGLFWAWPHVEVGGKEYDLWEKPGMKIQFVRHLGRSAGRTSATLGVESGWFVGRDKIMTERVWLTAYEASDTARAIDVEGTWIPVDRPVTLSGREAKSYGGMTIRFAIPRGKSGTITVPSGLAKEDLAVTRLPWADLTYTFGGASASGAALMVSKSHPDYPPTWLTRHYGPLCVGYPGVVKRTLEPGKPMTLRYRLWVHKGAVGLKGLKAAYDAYLSGENLHWE